MYLTVSLVRETEFLPDGGKNEAYKSDILRVCYASNGFVHEWRVRADLSQFLGRGSNF